MKTRKQKVICRFLCMVVSIFLLASFFVVPVSADVDELTQVTISNILYKYGMGAGGNYDPDYLPYPNLVIFSSSFNTFTVLDQMTSGLGDFYPNSIWTTIYSMTYDFNLENCSEYNYGVYYINQLFDDNVVRSFAKGDTVFLDPGEIPIWVYGDFSITKCRFTLRDEGSSDDFNYGSVIASTDIISCDLVEDSDLFIFDQLSFSFSRDVESSNLCLCFEFLVSDPTDEIQIEIEAFDVSFKFGSGVSPNYPIYPAAPGEDQINGLGSKEDQLLNDSAAGLQEGINSIGKVNSILSGGRGVNGTDLHLAAFATNLSGIMGRIADINGIGDLVYISLSLGLFASLFGLAGSIISAADRKAGHAKREAARSASKK